MVFDYQVFIHTKNSPRVHEVGRRLGRPNLLIISVKCVGFSVVLLEMGVTKMWTNVGKCGQNVLPLHYQFGSTPSAGKT